MINSEGFGALGGYLSSEVYAKALISQPDSRLLSQFRIS